LFRGSIAKNTLWSVSRFHFGSFELAHEIAPRYFLVTYHLNQKKYADIEKEDAQEHIDLIQKAVEKQKIVFKGEVLGSEEASKPELFYIFNGRDEREPHNFLKSDALYQQGFVDNWQIKELDLVHKERDDELVLHGKYS